MARIPARSSRQSSGQPTATTPVISPVVETGKNIPGRGVVDHGVPAPAHRDWNSDDIGQEPKPFVDFAPVHTEPVAIPVYTVAGPGQGNVVHAFRTSYAAVGPIPVMIAGQHENRTKLRIANRGTQTLYIGDTPQVNLMNGYPIVAGSSMDINSSRAVYGILDRTLDGNGVLIDNQPVNVFEEYDVTI